MRAFHLWFALATLPAQIMAQPQTISQPPRQPQESLATVRDVLDFAIEPGLSLMYGFPGRRTMGHWASDMRVVLEQAYGDLVWAVVLYRIQHVPSFLRSHPSDIWIRDGAVCNVERPPESCRQAGSALSFSYSWEPASGPPCIDRNGRSLRGALLYYPKAMKEQNAHSSALLMRFFTPVVKKCAPRLRGSRKKVAQDTPYFGIAECIAREMAKKPAICSVCPDSPKAVFIFGYYGQSSNVLGGVVADYIYEDEIDAALAPLNIMLLP